MIDSHQHFWRISRGDCEWPGADLPAIYRDFLPEDYSAAVEGLDLEGTVLVQSQPCDSDTDFLLGLAEEHELVLAVVGWVDLTGDRATERLAHLSQHPKFRGVRPMLQSMRKSDWILDDDCRAALEEAQRLMLCFDALIQPRHLKVIAELARRYPELAIVVDHAAKPDIAHDAFAQWAEDIEALGARDNISCKLSGLLTEATQEQCEREEVFQPYVEHLFRTFGTERFIWGSDWPVCTLRTGLAEWYAMSERLLKHCVGDDIADARKKIFTDNAKRFYRINHGGA